MNHSIWTKLINKPPILFPLAALFHIIITCTAIYSLYPTPLNQRDWLRPLGMMLFSLLAVCLCLMRKWSAIAYVSFSVVSLLVYYYSPIDTPQHIFSDSFFPFSMILSFFILLFFKRFK